MLYRHGIVQVRQKLQLWRRFRIFYPSFFQNQSLLRDPSYILELRSASVCVHCHHQHLHYEQMHQTFFKWHSSLNAWKDCPSCFFVGPRTPMLQISPVPLCIQTLLVAQSHRSACRLSSQTLVRRLDTVWPYNVRRLATRLGQSLYLQTFLRDIYLSLNTCALA